MSDPMNSTSASTTHAAEAYFPPPEAQGGWRTLVPANQEPTAAQKQAVRATAGLDWDKLREVWDHCQSYGGLHGVLVIRHGWIAGEWSNFAEPEHGIASCTKSLTGLAMAKLFDLSDAGQFPERVDIDDEAWRYLPAAWAEAEPARKQIKLRHLLTMTSGLTPFDGPSPGDYLETMFAQRVEAAPGTLWAYSSTSVDLLSLVVEHVTGQTLGAFFNAEIAAAIGAAPSQWGYFGEHANGSGMTRCTARDLARVGYLVLHGGVWGAGGEAKQVISAERVTQFSNAAPWLAGVVRREPNFAFEPNANRYYGHLWWTNRTGEALGEGAPRDVVYMSGWGKQACFVAPSLDMVAIRLGRNAALNQDPLFYHGFWARLMAALTDRLAEA
jgi:CubicO group peptidase (beta-lactamase class C family)